MSCDYCGRYWKGEGCNMTERKILLSSIISPAFYDIHQDILSHGHVHYWLKGGRGSGKSSFVSVELILGMMADPQAHAVVLRKVAANLKDSVFEQLWWAIRSLGVEQEWESKTYPMEMKYKKSGQRIIFKGADRPKKIKSAKFRDGYVKYIWYEEVDEFAGMDEIRTINQSLMRGGKDFVVFYSFNPPKSLKNWVNGAVLEPRADTLVHHSTYLTMPKEWLGEQFFWEAAYMERRHTDSYRHEYLGEAIGCGGEIFSNIVLRQIPAEEMAAFDHIARGLDWGYARDPLHYTVNHYDSARRRLYIFYELHKAGMSNRLLAAEIPKENPDGETVVCDSAEPKSIAELREYGIDAIGAKKGPDSVGYGIKWLQDLEEIVIDPIRCPMTAKEFTEYALEEDGNGGWKAYFPDRDNHAIDAVRYSREQDMRPIQIW